MDVCDADTLGVDEGDAVLRILGVPLILLGSSTPSKKPKPNIKTNARIVLRWPRASSSMVFTSAIGAFSNAIAKIATKIAQFLLMSCTKFSHFFTKFFHLPFTYHFCTIVNNMCHG